MKILISIAIVLSICITANAQNQYVLLDVSDESDLNYAAINELNYNPAVVLDSVFSPITGNFKVFRFIEMTLGYGIEDDDSIQEFHDLLIIKIDKKNRIVDAYQYTIEWAEYPSSCDLYRLHKKSKKKFENGFQLRALKLKLVGNPTYCDRDRFLSLSQLLSW